MSSLPVLVLIDGDCALCSRAAQWFAVRDRRGNLLFAPNTGETARILGEPVGGDSGTVVVWQGSRRLVRSAAVRAMLTSLGGPWAWLALGGACVPVAWADALYNVVARRRHWLRGATGCTFLSPHSLAD